jgi:hypothetical protein
MAPIDEALEYLESHRLEENISYKRVAEIFSVSRHTLARRHKGITQSMTTKHQQQRKITPQAEAGLVQYIQGLSNQHMPPTRNMIQNFVSKIAKEEVSEAWVTRFLNRHPDEIISKWATGMDSVRHQAESKDNYKLWFQILAIKIDKYGIEEKNMYNMDEKGFMIGIVGRTKRVFDKSTYHSKEVRESLSDGTRKWITTVGCICADGTALPPGLIFLSKNSTLQSSWVATIQAAQHDVFVSSSPKGWSSEKVGMAWLEQVFERCTKAKSGRSWRLLIADGHGSHITQDFINFCEGHRILLAILPPHSTQTLQPLDVALFAPLAVAYTKELSLHLQRSQGLLPVKKGDFFELFWTAWSTAFTKETILSFFRATGINPLNADVVLQKFNHHHSNSSSRESSESALSADD